MNKGDTSIGVPPGDLMTDFPPAQSVAPPRKRSFFRKFVAFLSRHRQRTTASPVNVETNYGTLGEFITVITYLLYELVLTGVGHSAANMPSDRSAMPPAKGSNLAPLMPIGGQMATTSSVDMDMNYSAFGEFCHDDNTFPLWIGSDWCRSLNSEHAF